MGECIQYGTFLPFVDVEAVVCNLAKPGESARIGLRHDCLDAGQVSAVPLQQEVLDRALPFSTGATGQQYASDHGAKDKASKREEPRRALAGENSLEPDQRDDQESGGPTQQQRNLPLKARPGPRPDAHGAQLDSRCAEQHERHCQRSSSYVICIE